MAASPVTLSPAPFSPVPLPISRPALSGILYDFRVANPVPTLTKDFHSIYRPSKPATQSGTWHQHHWRMDWDILQRGHRWENPLMGWQSSADGMQGTNLKFKSKEDAIAFAQKQGYEYFVQEPNERRFVPKAYANNFLHENRKLKHIKTK
jgi:NADH dehydrogenase (ubiquinone) Fe-S protein 4